MTGGLPEALQAGPLDVSDLTASESAPLDVVLEFRQRVGPDRLALWRAQAVEAFNGLPSAWIELAVPVCSAVEAAEFDTPITALVKFMRSSEDLTI
jgi:hypothetical protein